jgi:hypothetical protein
MIKLYNFAFINKRRIPQIPEKTFTLPQTCLPAGRYSEMTGCGSYFALRKSGYKNFTFPKYSEMTGCGLPTAKLGRNRHPPRRTLSENVRKSRGTGTNLKISGKTFTL